MNKYIENYLDLKASSADLCEGMAKHVRFDTAVVLGGLSLAPSDDAPVEALAVSVEAPGPLARLHLVALVRGPV
jgi:hypothetical protein